jgi:hypothetical protein
MFVAYPICCNFLSRIFATLQTQVSTCLPNKNVIQIVPVFESIDIRTSLILSCFIMEKFPFFYEDSNTKKGFLFMRKSANVY